MNSTSVLSVTIWLLLTARAVSGDDFTIGYWPFDGHLHDASGAGFHAAGSTARFADGLRGQSFDPQWSHALSAPTALEVGNWSHVAATYDNHTMKLYIDGECVSQLARGGMIHPAGANVYVGSYAANHPSAFFRGLMDEVRICDRCLTHQEIIERFHATTP